MNIYELVRARQSDRKYDSSRPISREILTRIIDAARLAPSACNAQPWSFVVVDEPALLTEVAHTLTKMNKFALSATAIIVMVEEPANLSSRLGGFIKGRHYADIDLGIACENLCLAATHEGIGSCIIGWYNQDKLRDLLSIPKNRSVRLVVTLGYSMERSKNKQRKTLEQICSFNQYKK